MEARVTVPHAGRRRGTVVTIDARLAAEKGRLTNTWLVPLPSETPPKPAKAEGKGTTRRKRSKTASAAEAQPSSDEA